MLAVRVQQVGQVGVQRRHPMLVSELPAELEGLGRQRQRLVLAAGLGQQPGKACSSSATWSTRCR